MGNAVLRWKLVDPYDTNAATKTYTFPRNPREMTSVYPERQVSTVPTIMNKKLFYEGGSAAKQFTFSGPILEKSHFDALRQWCYERKRRVNIHDHFGRVIDCVLLSVEMVPKRRNGYYYSHEYTVTALAAKVTEPTVPNEGYNL